MNYGFWKQNIREYDDDDDDAGYQNTQSPADWTYIGLMFYVNSLISRSTAFES